MIDYIKGELAELNPAEAVVEACGVGYAMGISLNTYSAIESQKQVKLYVYEKERELFMLLISVSGIGANTARMVLSSMSPNELCHCISTGNERMIKSIKGIGLKTAQRIIVDLRDKIVSLGIVAEIPAGGSMTQPVNNKVKDEAVSALTMLGFSPAPSAKTVMAILEKMPDAPVEEVVKRALKEIK